MSTLGSVQCQKANLEGKTMNQLCYRALCFFALGLSSIGLAQEGVQSFVGSSVHHYVEAVAKKGVERIWLIPHGSSPHKILLKRDDGVVVAIQDKAVMALLARQAAVSLLYFSRDAYDEAIQGLNKQEINKVIDLRVKEWAPKALH